MILVVDDHPDIRRVMTIILQMEGYEVATAACGQEALDQMRLRRPDCVVLDLSMPGMDGFDVLHAIRGDERLRDARVIVYSAHDGPMKDRALAAGADAFVLKTSLDWLKIDGLLGALCGPVSRPKGNRDAPARRTRDIG